MSAKSASACDPCTYKGLTFHDAAIDFKNGSDTPRDYLERCLATIDAREPAVKAFAHLNKVIARAAADASAERWAAGKPLSPIDGMPVGVQLIGQQHEDAPITSCARWMLDNINPVVAASTDNACS